MRVRVVALTLCTLLPSGLVHAYGLGEVRDPELRRIAERASSYLLRTRLPDGGWTWNARERQVAPNYGGLVAESLLAAYEQNGDAIYLEAARDYADQLLLRYEQRAAELPYKPDVELLVRVTEVSGEPAYLEVAQAWFANVMRRSPHGDLEVSRILAGRGADADLVGYDIALGIRAALAVEELEYARQLADAALSRRAEWLKRPRATFGTISRAALLDALTELDRGRYAPHIKQLSQELLAEQGENGSWCVNETQATAYAVRALAQQKSKTMVKAAKRGGKWLSASLLSRGAWAHFNDGMPEPFVGDVISAVQAEALTAVIMASKL